MATRAYINIKTLKYLRESRGVDVEYVCRGGIYTIEQYLKWEAEELPDLPTLRQAKEVAKQLRIPFAALYMDQDCIPKQPEIPSYVDKRSLGLSSRMDASALRLALIELANMRELLLEAQADFDIPFIQFDITRTSNDDIKAMASWIRQKLELDIDEQCKTDSKRKLYLYLKSKIERQGVFVQGFTGVPVETVRGVALYYSILPIIGINDRDRPPAKSFSLIHELVHIVNRSSSVCNDMFDRFSANKEEVYCNAVAGEVLVPEQELVRYMERNAQIRSLSIDFFGDIADHFSVSSEVIIRRLFDIGAITQGQYEAYASELQQLYTLSKEERKVAEQNGQPFSPYMPNVARDTVDNTSFSLSRVFLIGYGMGEYSAQDITRYLGIKEKHLETYFLEAAKWSS